MQSLSQFIDEALIKKDTKIRNIEELSKKDFLNKLKDFGLYTVDWSIEKLLTFNLEFVNFACEGKNYPSIGIHLLEDGFEDKSNFIGTLKNKKAFKIFISKDENNIEEDDSKFKEFDTKQGVYLYTLNNLEMLSELLSKYN
jgi:hypothetical protein